MNKIEEILQGKGITPTTKCHNYEYLYKAIQESMMKFGKLAFEAGREYSYVNPTTCTQGFIFDYETYEDFLKEIEDERD